MRILFDTSVLVAALVTSHTFHAPAAKALQRIKDGQDIGVIAMHSLAELYSILTRLPLQPKISADAAQKMIQPDVLAVFDVAGLTPDDYATVIQQVANRHMTGGIIYDAIIMQAAIKAEVEQVLTLNRDDFVRIVPQWANKVVEP